jgi:hypothetical protein
MDIRDSSRPIKSSIQALARRVPDEFESKLIGKLMPFEITLFVPFPSMFGATLHLIKHIADQLKPTSIGRPLVTHLVASCPKRVNNRELEA